MRTLLTAARLLNGASVLEDPVVSVEDGRIVSIESRADAPVPDASGTRVIDFPDATLSAAFLDVHTHGAAGHDVMEATPDALQSVGRFLASRGTGTYLATTVTAPLDATLRSLSGLAKLITQPPDASQAVT